MELPIRVYYLFHFRPLTFSIAKLGANAILAISMVFCQYAASQKGIPLFKHLSALAGSDTCSCPLPFLNVINGGAHAGNSLAFQEFMIVPTAAHTFEEAMQWGAEVYQCLKSIIKSRYGQTGICIFFIDGIFNLKQLMWEMREDLHPMLTVPKNALAYLMRQ